MAKRRRNRKHSKGSWTLERERFRLAPSAVSPPPDNVFTVAEVVSDVLANALPSGVRWAMELEQEWTSLVGNTVAQHARPGRIDGKILFVYVDSAVWLNELKRFAKSGILEKVQQRFGGKSISAVRLVPDPDGPRGSKRS